MFKRTSRESSFEHIRSALFIIRAVSFANPLIYVADMLRAETVYVPFYPSR